MGPKAETYTFNQVKEELMPMHENAELADYAEKAVKTMQLGQYLAERKTGSCCFM